MQKKELHLFLEEKYERYNRPEFIISDPISIPHQFSKKQDIEIAGFLAATIAWGQRTTIIKNANELMKRMDFAPHDFIMNHTKNDLLQFKNFKHRTFNGVDCIFFMKSLQNIYKKHSGLENIFAVSPSPVLPSRSALSEQGGEGLRMRSAIFNFRKIFFSIPHPQRTRKHVSLPPPPTPSSSVKQGSGRHGSACKRLNMFLRWMVRKDKRGVDFGIWNQIPLSPPLQGRDKTLEIPPPYKEENSALRNKGILSSQLMCPLDIHSGNAARKLGLLHRKQNDWLSVEELTNHLREFDTNDPVKYDFSLFGISIFEKF